MVVEFLRYGWPVGFEGPLPQVSECVNHQGARDFPRDVGEFLKKELEMGAVIGPFKSSPFPGQDRISPLNTVPKKGSSERRVILDLSFPEGKSINEGIPRESYLGDPFRLSFPSIDNLVELVKEKGPGCQLFKRDLKRAYRQIPVCPGDVHLLGYRFQGHLVYDRVLPMGMRSSAQMCQRVTNCSEFHLQKSWVQDRELFGRFWWC